MQLGRRAGDGIDQTPCVSELVALSSNKVVLRRPIIRRQS